VYGVRQGKNIKKGNQVMNPEIIILEVEEMEEMIAPGLALAE